MGRAVPRLLAEAHGARLVDVDGNEYVDFCLGDTGAMTGHSPAGTVAAIARQLDRGITTMLPTEDADLGRRGAHAPLRPRPLAVHGVRDRREPLRRPARRQITGRPKILVFDYCYHGTVDETFATLDGGVVRARDGNVGPPVDPALTTKVVECNDVAALEAALAPGDVACVLAEPALTNIGIVLPGARLPRCAARAHPPDGHAARDRRDAHDLDEPGRLHGARSGSSPTCSRSARRSGAASRRAPTASPRRSRGGSSRRRTPTTRTSAASAARSPATRSRSPRCARRSRTCSPRRRTRT